MSDKWLSAAITNSIRRVELSERTALFITQTGGRGLSSELLAALVSEGRVVPHSTSRDGYFTRDCAERAVRNRAVQPLSPAPSLLRLAAESYLAQYISAALTQLACSASRGQLPMPERGIVLNRMPNRPFIGRHYHRMPLNFVRTTSHLSLAFFTPELPPLKVTACASEIIAGIGTVIDAALAVDSRTFRLRAGGFSAVQVVVAPSALAPALAPAPAPAPAPALSPFQALVAKVAADQGQPVGEFVPTGGNRINPPESDLPPAPAVGSGEKVAAKGRAKPVSPPSAALPDALAALSDAMRQHGVKRLVLPSGGLILEIEIA